VRGGVELEKINED